MPSVSADESPIAGRVKRRTRGPGYEPMSGHKKRPKVAKCKANDYGKIPASSAQPDTGVAVAAEAHDTLSVPLEPSQQAHDTSSTAPVSVEVAAQQEVPHPALLQLPLQQLHSIAESPEHSLEQLDAVNEAEVPVPPCLVPSEPKPKAKRYKIKRKQPSNAAAAQQPPASAIASNDNTTLPQPTQAEVGAIDPDVPGTRESDAATLTSWVLSVKISIATPPLCMPVSPTLAHPMARTAPTSAASSLRFCSVLGCQLCSCMMRTPMFLLSHHGVAA